MPQRKQIDKIQHFLLFLGSESLYLRSNQCAIIGTLRVIHASSQGKNLITLALKIKLATQMRKIPFSDELFTDGAMVWVISLRGYLAKRRVASRKVVYQPN